MAVSLDNVGSIITNNLTTAYATAGSDRALLFLYKGLNGTDATAVTYGGQALTKLGTITAQGFVSSLWGILGPPVGNNNLVITTAETNYRGLIISYNGANDLLHFTSQSGSSNTDSISVTSASGDWALEFIDWGSNFGLSVNNSQVIDFNDSSNGFYFGHKTGTANPALGVTWTNPVGFHHYAISLVAGSQLPTVTTQAASSVGQHAATGNGNITGTGGFTPTERGVVYSLTSHGDPGNVAPASSDYEGAVTETGSFSTGAFTESLTGLISGTVYYARAYAKNVGGYAYGAEVNFTTTDDVPVVTTQAASSVASTSIVGNGTIVHKGTAANASNRGFVYDTVPHALPGNVVPGSSGYANNANDAGSYGDGAFTKSVTGLSPNTTYYVRAYAGNSVGYAYGNEITVKYSTPTVTTQPPTDVASTEMVGNGTIVSLQGGANCDITGFVYDISSHALPGDVAPGASGYASSASNSGSFGLGLFQKKITGLTGGVTYYIRAYAHIGSNGGYGYGAQFSITLTAHETVLDIASTLVVSGYKWLTKKLYNAQQLFVTQPYFTLQIIDDSIKPTGVSFASVEPTKLGSAAPTPDDNIVAAGFGADGKIHFWKGRNLANGTWDKDVILDPGVTSAHAPNVAIAVSEYYLGGYHIDVAFLDNYNDGSLGADVILRLWRSDDSGNSWTLQSITLTDLPFTATSAALWVALMKPRLVSGVMTSGFIYLLPTGVTMGIGFQTHKLRYGVYPNTSIATWDGNVDSADWTISSIDSYYLNGTDYIVLAGFRNIIDPSPSSFNYGLWLTGILRRTSDPGTGATPDVWLPPVPIMVAGSSSPLNLNQYFYPKATVQNGHVDIMLRAVSTDAIYNSLQTIGSVLATTVKQYMRIFSLDGENFSYPQIMVDASDTVIVAPNSNDNLLQSFVKQDNYYYLCGGHQIYQFIQNNVVADVAADTIGYKINETAGQAANITLQIANQNNQWYGNTPTKPGASAIAPNSKIVLWQGYYDTDGNPAVVPRGIFYIDDIQQQISGNQNELTIVGRDWNKKLLTTITRFTIQWLGAFFYSDIFDGTTLGKWNQIAGSWSEQTNQLVPESNTNGQDASTASIITLGNVPQATQGALLVINMGPPGPGTSSYGGDIYIVFIDSTHWVRLSILSETGPSFSAYIQYQNGGAVVNLDFIVLPIATANWATNNLMFFIRQYDYYKFNFLYTNLSLAVADNPLLAWNSATLLKGSTTGEFDLSSIFQNNADMQKDWSVGVGTTGPNVPPFSYFRYVKLGPVNSILSVAKSLAAKAGIMVFKVQQFFNEPLMLPSFTGTFSIHNRHIVIPASGKAMCTDSNKNIGNGELIFKAKVAPILVGAGKQFGFMFVFRNTTNGGTNPYNAYRFRVTQYVDSNGVSACRFERLVTNSTTYLFPNSPADDQSGPAPTIGSLGLDITQYHEYRIDMVDGWMYAYIDGIMAAAWNDNNTDIAYLSSGSWGFQAADSNSAVTIKDIKSPNFWKPVQAFSLNPGDDTENAIMSLVQSIRGWIFSDLLARMKFLLLSSSDSSSYTYDDQILTQSVDKSDKEFISQVTVYGTGVMATASDKSLMAGVPVRDAIIVDYKILTQIDAQTRANQELRNFNQYIDQFGPTEVMNVGAELFDAVTVINTGINTAGTDSPTRVYAEMFTSGGGTNKTDYAIQIQTGSL